MSQGEPELPYTKEESQCYRTATPTSSKPTHCWSRNKTEKSTAERARDGTAEWSSRRGYQPTTRTSFWESDCIQWPWGNLPWPEAVAMVLILSKWRGSQVATCVLYRESIVTHNALHIKVGVCLSNISLFLRSRTSFPLFSRFQSKEWGLSSIFTMWSHKSNTI